MRFGFFLYGFVGRENIVHAFERVPPLKAPYLFDLVFPRFLLDDSHFQFFLEVSQVYLF